MGLFENLLSGFQIASQPSNLMLCLLGVLTGTFVGVLPGIGPVAAISILLPSTFGLDPVGAIIMLGGIYYGAQYGGSTTSILLNMPGESTAVVTCLDGYRMTLQGQAGRALGIAAFGSFIGGTFSVIGLTLLAPPLSRMALGFGPPEYFSLMFLSMTMLAYLGRGSVAKSFAMAAFGLFLGQIGMDVISGVPRFTFGTLQLTDGIGLIPVLMGIFGVAEVLANSEKTIGNSLRGARVKGLLPRREDWRRSVGPIARGSVLGFLFGILPGSGGIVSTFTSYALEKRISKHPEKFGTGMIEGVAGPETANNAATGGAYIPLLTLGLPSNVSMAVLLGALVMHGVQPGPLLLGNDPGLFWGIVASMYIGNLMLLALNLPLVGLWLQVLKIPYPFLLPLVLLMCFVGAYSLNNSFLDVSIMAGFGMFGYLLRKCDYEPAPLVLGMVLGPTLERTLRQTLLMSRGEPSILLARPISVALMLAACVLIVSPFFSFLRGALRGRRSIGGG